VAGVGVHVKTSEKLVFLVIDRTLAQEARAVGATVRVEVTELSVGLPDRVTIIPKRLLSG
jgi:hypothetical protein